MNINMNGILLIILIISLITMLLTLTGKSDCQVIVQEHPSCPDIKKDLPHTNTPTGKCLFDCDQNSNTCYNQCNGDEQCVKECYENKAKCYMNCLNNSHEKFTNPNNCGCGS